jgi:hypothetical protein
MKFCICLAFVLTFPPAQKAEIAYLLRGDLVEQEFRDYHKALNAFYGNLRQIIERDAPDLAPDLADAPPQPVVFGYQLLPRLVEPRPDADPQSLQTREYSWPLTEGYIRGEFTKLRTVQERLNGATEKTANDDRHALLKQVASNYRELVGNEKTIDQFVEYNRFWQRAIASDRFHYDQLTEIFYQLQKDDPDTNKIIRDVLGKPDAPKFIRVLQPRATDILLSVPMYTDIEDEAFLTKVASITKDFWTVEDSGVHYSVNVEWHRVSPEMLYAGSKVPAKGEHLDIRAHTARFPSDGAVLTTGAESTYSVVGRFIALSSNDASYATIAHEFGHILGFRDGYMRGYKDLGAEGFEILEMTPTFDDIMSAPRSGRVQATHFKLLLDALSLHNGF